MKAIILLTLFLSPAWAEIWEKPSYVPDENHLPPDVPMRRIQEQEERPKPQKEKMPAKEKEKSEKEKTEQEKL